MNKLLRLATSKTVLGTAIVKLAGLAGLYASTGHLPNADLVAAAGTVLTAAGVRDALHKLELKAFGGPA